MYNKNEKKRSDQNGFLYKRKCLCMNQEINKRGSFTGGRRKMQTRKHHLLYCIIYTLEGNCIIIEKPRNQVEIVVGFSLNGSGTVVHGSSDRWRIEWMAPESV